MRGSPTSDRDEDLPIDLDHIVPVIIFGFDWRYCESRLDSKKYPFLKSDNFRWGRGVLGNSLGNFRWVDASDNRSRGKGAFVALDSQGDLVENPARKTGTRLFPPMMTSVHGRGTMLPHFSV